MAISDADSKLLWGRAAGLCSNPNCGIDITTVLEERRSYNLGEIRNTHQTHYHYDFAPAVYRVR